MQKPLSGVQEWGWQVDEERLGQRDVDSRRDVASVGERQALPSAIGKKRVDLAESEVGQALNLGLSRPSTGPCEAFSKV